RGGHRHNPSSWPGVRGSALACCETLARRRYTAPVSRMPTFQPMRLARRAQPFDHPDFLYEIKFDGFRALAYIEDGKCRLVSRRRHEYTSFHDLCHAIAA